MVLVPVGEHDGPHPVGAILQVTEVRQDEVDAEVLVSREGKPGVDDDDVLADSKTVMFFPTSPSPPSGMMRRAVTA